MELTPNLAFPTTLRWRQLSSIQWVASRPTRIMDEPNEPEDFAVVRAARNDLGPQWIVWEWDGMQAHRRGTFNSLESAIRRAEEIAV